MNRTAAKILVYFLPAKQQSILKTHYQIITHVVNVFDDFFRLMILSGNIHEDVSIKTPGRF
ncbi:hypothetical protein DVR12_01690 [Chitinophaga silvatica]|uniref:Uncharacterized protein n=1 Tax=Chitinophaga silvatica TaxID=2282649 RepID=A0A3E1YGH9_9BACT|nr:hypothetical protein [Chitinophaga silvatica]RFS26525.1 hypothetical protein DVR12_01690 [Chitinophaga silvatica]